MERHQSQAAEVRSRSTLPLSAETLLVGSVLLLYNVTANTNNHRGKGK